MTFQNKKVFQVQSRQSQKGRVSKQSNGVTDDARVILGQVYLCARLLAKGVDQQPLSRVGIGASQLLVVSEGVGKRQPCLSVACSCTPDCGGGSSAGSPPWCARGFKYTCCGSLARPSSLVSQSRWYHALFPFRNLPVGKEATDRRIARALAAKVARDADCPA